MVKRKKNLTKRNKKSLNNKKAISRVNKKSRNILSKKATKKVKTFDMNQYKWVTKGTCQSNKMKNLKLRECREYFPDNNYKTLRTRKGPPGCWLVLGNRLNEDIKRIPEVVGNKGFVCWTRANVKDEKRCSPEEPCVCK